MTPSRIVLFVALFLTPAWLFADDSKQVEEWLEKMHSAAHSINYIGTFVYQQGKQLTAMRIVHAVDDQNGERERLVAQDAIGREVVRDKGRVIAILPDIHSVVVQKGRPEFEFPPEFPVDIDDLIGTYSFTLGKQEHVAGRSAQKIIIKPKDKYRYGYRLWVDSKTGLLLKKQSFDERNRVLELFMFTAIEYKDNIPDEMLEPGIASKDFKWIETDDVASNAEVEGGWAVRSMPAGFIIDIHRQHRLPNSQIYADHIVYTDGLASVSIFVEPLTGKSKKINGASRVGVVNAYGRSFDKYHILAVGEVPQATVKMISESVYYDKAEKPHD